MVTTICCGGSQVLKGWLPSGEMISIQQKGLEGENPSGPFAWEEVTFFAEETETPLRLSGLCFR